MVVLQTGEPPSSVSLFALSHSLSLSLSLFWYLALEAQGHYSVLASDHVPDTFSSVKQKRH